MRGSTADRRLLAIVVAASLALLIAGSAALPLLDRDEPRFARATVEMIARGDWVVPFFNDSYRFDKPPLTYWLMAAGYGVFGVTEFGARVHSIIAATLAAALLFLFGRRLFSTRVGFVAGFAWVTCLQVYVHGRLALADMPMVLSVLVTHWALYELLLAPAARHETRWVATLWCSLAIGFLAKGPIAVISPALTLVFTRLFFGRRPLPWRRLRVPLGLPLLLTLIGAWGIPALIRTSGQYWQVGIGEHVVRRGLVAFNERPIIPLYYVATIFLSLFPWSPALGQAVFELRTNWNDDTNKFLCAWVLGPFLVFSFYSTQLPHYTLPAFPALLLLVFRRGAVPTHATPGSRRLYYGLHALFATLITSLVAYLLTLSLPAEIDGLRRSGIALAAVLLALQASAVLFARAASRSSASAASLSAGYAPALVAVIAAAMATTVFATSMRPLTLPHVLQQRFLTMPDTTRYLARGYTEPSLVFYADSTWDLGAKRPTRDLLGQDGPLFLLYRVNERGLDRVLRPRAEAVAFESIDTAAKHAAVPRWLIDSDLQRELVQGFNFARATWTELVVFYRL